MDMIVVIYFGLMMRNLLIGQDGVASLRIPALGQKDDDDDDGRCVCDIGRCCVCASDWRLCG